MAKAKLVINGEREMTIGEGVVSIGRALDNTVPLADDSNVSRYHAEIESRGDDEFWLIELGSSNGTTVNDTPVYSESLLRDGDLIVFGGSSEILFEIEKAAPLQESADQPAAGGNAPDAAGAAAAGATPNLPAGAPALPSAGGGGTAAAAAVPADATKASKMPLLLMIAGGVCVVAIVFVAIAVAVSWSGGSKCEAKAVITKPESGDTISKEIEIEIEASDTDCARRAVFLMDGDEFASAEEFPYTVTLDPKKFPLLSDGDNHTLRVVFEDEEGKRIDQSAGEVLLAFETLSTPTPTPEIVKKTDGSPTPSTTQKGAAGKQASLIEIQNMSKRLLAEFGGNTNYKFDPQFLQEVQKKTAEYAAEEGFFSRAEPFRDLINIEFYKEKGLAPPLGFILAMSRSKFKLQKQGTGEGLWQLSEGFAAGNNYKALCVAESLSDPTQNCAAKSAALYSKAMFSNIFDPNAGGLVYAVAAFGMSEGEASQWQSSLTGDRADFWRNIRQPAQRDQVVRFFAAGIVAENPQNFGMKRDRPISDLYRNLMAK